MSDCYAPGSNLYSGVPEISIRCCFRTLSWLWKHVARLVLAIEQCVRTCTMCAATAKARTPFASLLDGPSLCALRGITPRRNLVCWILRIKCRSARYCHYPPFSSPFPLHGTYHRRSRRAGRLEHSTDISHQQRNQHRCQPHRHRSSLLPDRIIPALSAHAKR